VSSPDGDGPFGLQSPGYDPAVRIAGEQTSVLADYLDAVDLGSMAAENIAWLGRRECGGLALRGHGEAACHSTLAEVDVCGRPERGRSTHGDSVGAEPQQASVVNQCSSVEAASRASRRRHCPLHRGVGVTDRDGRRWAEKGLCGYE
jgi:hypothetical protein